MIEQKIRYNGVEWIQISHKGISGRLWTLPNLKFLKAGNFFHEMLKKIPLK